MSSHRNPRSTTNNSKPRSTYPGTTPKSRSPDFPNPHSSTATSSKPNPHSSAVRHPTFLILYGILESMGVTVYLILARVMGQTGVGKSSFINAAAGQDIMTVGHGLHSCTEQVMDVRCSHPFDSSKAPTLLVDTPGFDDSNMMEDSQVMALIIEWLKSLADDGGMEFGGIIYLSEGKQDRLPLLNELRGNATISRAILHVKTKTPQRGERFFTNDRESAWSIIDEVMKQPCTNDISLTLMQLDDVTKRLPKPKPIPKPNKKTKKSFWQRIFQWS